MEGKAGVRLRQAVLVAAELEPVEAALREAVGLGEPFRDPGVAGFGLVNGVFALGDCFLEVVSPMQEGTAAGRYLDRHGDAGYMAIFDLEDLEGARARARELGVRTVWEIDLPDISGTHLHPADLQGAIVSLDQSRPAGTWRWGGPEWIGQVGRGAPGRLLGITIAVDDPVVVAARWGEVLGVGVAEEGSGGALLRVDNGQVRFDGIGEDDREGLVEIAVGLPEERRRDRDAVEVGGVLLRLLEMS